MEGFTRLSIILDGDGSLREYAGKIENAQLTKVIVLEGGMASGKPSVAVVVETSDGRAFLGETSLSLFLAAADAFKARHGDPRSDDTTKGGSQ